MKTTYYTITAREILVSGDGVEQAVGGGRQLVCARKTVPADTGAAKRNNVIDLAAWKARLRAAGAAGSQQPGAGVGGMAGHGVGDRRDGPAGPSDPAVLSCGGQGRMPERTLP